MCKRSPHPRCSNHARKAYESALKSGNEERIAQAREDFYTSPAGIQRLKQAGKEELAQKYMQRRLELVAAAKQLEGTNRPIRVGLDIDNTQGDFTAGLRKHMGTLAENAGLSPEQLLERYPEPGDYSYAVSGWYKDKEEFLSHFSAAEHGGVYRDMDAYQGVIETVRQMSESGDFEIHLVTARNKMWEAHTREWLQKHGIPFKTLTFTNDKETMDLDIFVDDADYQLTKLQAHGKKVLAYDQLYNARLKVPRVKAWADVPAAIKRIVRD